MLKEFGYWYSQFWFLYQICWQVYTLVLCVYICLLWYRWPEVRLHHINRQVLIMWILLQLQTMWLQRSRSPWNEVVAALVQMQQLMGWYLSRHQRARMRQWKLHIIHLGNRETLLSSRRRETMGTRSHQKEDIVVMIIIINAVHIEGAMAGNIITTISEIMIVGIKNGINIVEALITEIQTCNLQEVLRGVIFDPLYILLPLLFLNQCLCRFNLSATIWCTLVRFSIIKWLCY